MNEIGPIGSRQKGWELERISTKEEVGIWMEISCREIWDWKIWYQESMRARMKRRVVILVVRVIGKIGQMSRWFLGTTVLEDNRQDIEMQKGSANKIK